MKNKLVAAVLGTLLSAGCGPITYGDAGNNNCNNAPAPDSGSTQDASNQPPTGDGALPSQSCGNGLLEGDEECDEGSANSDTVPNVCRTDCTRPACGDGVVDSDNQEQCDDGADNANTPDANCQRNCQPPSLVSLNTPARFYNIVADSNDTVHMVWVQGINGNNVYYGTIVDGVLSTPELTPASGVNTTKHRPSIGVKPDGSEVHFTWVTPSVEPKRIKDCWRDANGAWTINTVHDFEPDGRNVQFPSIVVDANGVAHCTASDWIMANNDMPIAYFRKTPGGTWQRQSNLASPTEHNRESSMFVDAQGGVHVTWTIDKIDLKYRYAPSGGNLADSPTLDIPSDHTRNRWSEIFVDRQQNVHLASLSYQSPGTQTFANYTSKPLGATTFPLLVDTSTAPYETYDYIPSPVVGAVSGDRAAVALVEMFSTVHYQTKVADQWTTYTIDDTAAVLEHSRVVMATTRDTVHLVWRGGDGSLKLARYALLELSLSSPAGGESWASGSAQTLRWTAAGLTGDVKLDLYQNGVRVGAIASGIAADPSSHVWAVGALANGESAPTGGGYTIRIRTADGRFVNESQPFTITTAP